MEFGLSSPPVLLRGSILLTLPTEQAGRPSGPSANNSIIVAAATHPGPPSAGALGFPLCWSVAVVIQYPREILMKFRPAIIFVIVVTFALCWASTEANHSPIYITHVTVIDTETGAEATDQTVIISGDRIAAVQSTAVQIPAGAVVVDATGKYLIPGLWDMHVHGVSDVRAGWSYPLYIANGVTGVRDMWGPSNANKFRAHLAGKKHDAPHLYLASPIVDGNPPVWPGSIVVIKPEQGRKVVDEQKRNGADFIKVYNRLNRDTYFAIADESKRRQIPFAGHVPLDITAWEATAAGQRSIEHLTGIAPACSSQEAQLAVRLAQGSNPRERNPLLLQAWRRYSEEKCQRLLAEFKKNQTWQVPTLTVLRSQGRLDDAQFIRDPRLRHVPFQVRERWDPLSNSFAFRAWSAADFARSRELFEYDKKMVGTMFRAGVPMLAGTDTQNPYCFPGFSLHDELALLVESGVTPLGALQMATRNPASFMNAADRFGSVTTGKIADLVLLDADPLQDIHNTTRIRAVFLAGKYFDRAALDKLLK